MTASDGSFDSGTLESANSFEMTFSTPGTYGYVCAIHPDMTASVEVVDAEATNPEPAPTASAAVGAAAILADASTPSPVPLDASNEPASTATAAATGFDAAVPFTAGVLLITISVILFARAMRGAVRVADRA